ncbi:EVE domain-containing protein [Nakamurella silvestris]|nr:EVE domain-containing protein [Nakamurella silvestris]
MSEQRFWVNTISLDHLRIGIAGGFTQADHGAPTRLRTLGEGDEVVFYSPRTALRAGDPVQQFTAWGRVTADPIYQVTVSETAKPWRRNLVFQQVQPADIRPLIPQLSFIHNKENWGFTFRRGLFPIPREDFEVIRDSLRPT